MTFVLRPYQEAAVEASMDALAGAESPLVVLPTGTGKSGVAGTLKRRLCDEFGALRILNVTHVAELVEQNHRELIGMWDWAPAGIYSAGLGQRDLTSQILFAGIQSIHNKVKQLGAVDVLMIDEAHMIPRASDTMYGTFINRLRDANPDLRLLGLTATPFRLDSGRLDEPSTRVRNGVEVTTPALFERVCYDYPIREAFDDGYLTPLKSPGETWAKIDTRGVGRRGGEFIASELQAAADTDDLNRAIVDELIRYGQGRRSWLLFATGVEHAKHIAAEVQRRGIESAVVSGETPAGERKAIIEAFKSYRLRCVVNCGVLTTGFNHPGLDLIGCARPSESTGLYIQIAGRGTRNVYAPGHDLSTREGRLAAIAAGPKPNCLFLDWGGLIKRHGPIDDPIIRKPGKGGGDAPVKACPQCFTVVHASARECPDCNFQWEIEPTPKLSATASTAPILSKTRGEWVPITRRTFARHEKFGRPPSVRVEYWRGLSLVAKEWVAVENDRAAGIVKSWWRGCGGADPAPDTVDDMLERVGELRPIAEIRIEADGRYWKVTGRRNGGDAEDEVEQPKPSWPPSSSRDFTPIDDSEIPF